MERGYCAEKRCVRIKKKQVLLIIKDDGLALEECLFKLSARKDIEPLVTDQFGQGLLIYKAAKNIKAIGIAVSRRCHLQGARHFLENIRVDFRGAIIGASPNDYFRRSLARNGCIITIAHAGMLPEFLFWKE